eukprot:GHVN01100737.1.p1 GENE.GHVN01100737.1~~GHVN01100737.1.p1  ORF type:complete len:134 (-),score=1.45 GHVN01100737.1:167-568(-)
MPIYPRSEVATARVLWRQHRMPAIYVPPSVSLPTNDGGRSPFHTHTPFHTTRTFSLPTRLANRRRTSSCSAGTLEAQKAEPPSELCRTDLRTSASAPVIQGILRLILSRAVNMRRYNTAVNPLHHTVALWVVG